MAEFKPSIVFLRKVDSGEVFCTTSFTTRRGTYSAFTGGEVTAERHAQAGYVTMPRTPARGKVSYAELTDAGRAAIAAVGI